MRPPRLLYQETFASKSTLYSSDESCVAERLAIDAVSIPGVDTAICESGTAVGQSEKRRLMDVASIRYGPSIASRYA
jgi:hypothetical protein